jgi:hypothetical protein
VCRRLTLPENGGTSRLLQLFDCLLHLIFIGGGVSLIIRRKTAKRKGNDIMQNMSEEELMKKEAALVAEVERLLPDFVNSCRDKADVVIIHQDAFAADYQDHEYALLGKAIKFAGLHGKEVRIIGKNRETVKGASRPELLQ